eukprot:7431737-Alexandrium_andersonii.AAC.1
MARRVLQERVRARTAQGNLLRRRAGARQCPHSTAARGDLGAHEFRGGALSEPGALLPGETAHRTLQGAR